ncbi:MAG: anti-sigma factor antagonist [Methylobacteriaceae bacterium]|nr:anti-sigma factor antagonist [Methylobacteriaceae bacterium]
MIPDCTAGGATTFALPPVLDLNAASPLRDDLLALRGHPLTLDASAVDRIGALCLQVILAARASWEADGQPFAVAEPSSKFAECVSLLGASSLLPSLEGAALA